MNYLPGSRTPISLSTLQLYRDGLVPPDSRFPSIAPEAHFESLPELPPALQPLVKASASYAALTLRTPPSVAPGARAYPLLLLVGWLWDDLVDTHKEVPGIQRLIQGTLAQFADVLDIAWSAPNLEHLPQVEATPLLQTSVSASVTLLQQISNILTQQIPEYAPRVRLAFWEFLQSFAAKAQLRHKEVRSLENYSQIRLHCVGMLLCFELAYALKATAYGVPSTEALNYIAGPVLESGAHAATLHCAAVNDLFSVYKDRQFEDTANFPSVFAPDSSLDSYWVGANQTLRYIRELVQTVLSASQQLPGPDLLRAVVSETWLEMMEGNVLFHLTVPRYREGVELVKQLIDTDLTPDQSRRAFRSSFPPPATTPTVRLC